MSLDPNTRSKFTTNKLTIKTKSDTIFTKKYSNGNSSSVSSEPINNEEEHNEIVKQKVENFINSD